MIYYILDDEHNVVVAEDAKAWAAFFGDAAHVLASTYVDGVHVSTVFLGLDHNYLTGGVPLLFETIWFDGAEGGHLFERYATWQGAHRGHKRAVDYIYGEMYGGQA